MVGPEPPARAPHGAHYRVRLGEQCECEEPQLGRGADTGLSLGRLNQRRGSPEAHMLALVTLEKSGRTRLLDDHGMGERSGLTRQRSTSQPTGSARRALPLFGLLWRGRGHLDDFLYCAQYKGRCHTSRVPGLRSSRPSNRSSRRLSTSGRCCSAAWAVLFSRVPLSAMGRTANSRRTPSPFLRARVSSPSSEPPRVKCRRVDPDRQDFQHRIVALGMALPSAVLATSPAIAASRYHRRESQRPSLRSSPAIEAAGWQELTIRSSAAGRTPRGHPECRNLGPRT